MKQFKTKDVFRFWIAENYIYCSAADYAGIYWRYKKLSPHKTVEITIHPADDTEYILSNPIYSQVLQDRIAEYETKKQVISLKADDLI